MQNEDNLDSDHDVPESEQPNSQKEVGGDKRSSSSGQPKQADIGERIKRLEGMVSSLQNGKDRAIAGAKDEIAELREQFGAVTKLMKSRGISEDEAFDVLKAQKEDAEYKSAILEVRELLKGGKPVPAQAGEAKIDPSVAEIVKQYELDANDENVIAKVLSQTDSKEAELQALRLIHKRSSLQPSASAASTPIGTPTPHSSVDTLTREYQTKMRESMGKANANKRAQLKNEYLKLGVNVYDIDFT